MNNISLGFEPPVFGYINKEEYFKYLNKKDFNEIKAVTDFYDNEVELFCMKIKIVWYTVMLLLAVCGYIISFCWYANQSIAVPFGLDIFWCLCILTILLNIPIAIKRYKIRRYFYKLNIDFIKMN